MQLASSLTDSRNLALQIQELDELNITIVMDNETDTLSSPGAHEQTPESAGHLDRRSPSHITKGVSHISVFDHLCCACHGLSALLTATKDGTSHTVLFDVGPYPDIWVANAARLGVDLAQIELIFLSHWHWDHSGGLVDVIAAIAQARSEAGLFPVAVDVHPDRPDQRGVQVSSDRVALLPKDPTIDELTKAGAIVTTNAQDHAIANGFFLGSGEIERRTSFETGLAGHVTLKGDAFEPDPLIIDERYLAAHVRGRGVTVLSACSHAGIINATTAAMSRVNAPVDLVLGGYHLAGAEMEQRIEPTIAALRDLDPNLVAPGHCTGWRAKGQLAAAFEDTNRYTPSVVGSTYHLRAT